MATLLFLLLLEGAQPVLGPITKCPVVVEVVDVAWAPVPGIDVTMRDERMRSTEARTTDASGTVTFVVQSCADDRCRFTISAGQDSGFKVVTLKRLWFGAHQNSDRHVQIRLNGLKGPRVTVR